jgi:hypothetical protein
MTKRETNPKCENRDQSVAKVAQTSKSAVSRISQSAAVAMCRRHAGSKVGDTAGLESCASVNHSVVSVIWNLNFGFASDFGFRVSDFSRHLDSQTKGTAWSPC